MWPKSADIIITQQIITSGINTPKLHQHSSQRNFILCWCKHPADRKHYIDSSSIAKCQSKLERFTGRFGSQQQGHQNECEWRCNHADN